MRAPSRSLSAALALVAATAACDATDGAGGATRPETRSASDPSEPSVNAGSSNPPAHAVPTPPAPAPPPIVPDTFEAGAVDVLTVIHTDQQRHPISPLVYGMNSAPPGVIPPEVLSGVTFVRRGGDRCNAYDWETNVSNGALKASYGNDMFLAKDLASPNTPGELDRVMIAEDLAAGRGSLVPFVLNGYVAGAVASDIPFKTPGWPIDQYFKRVELVKPTPFSSVPDTSDGVVYTDEHLDFLRRKFPGDIYAPGPTQVMVGSDNEPDLYAYNFPMLQRGSGKPLFVDGVQVGNALQPAEFTARFIAFAKRVKQLEPDATIVGPDHFHYDGWTMFNQLGTSYSDAGRWYMDDFLADVQAASKAAGTRLLHTWDMHWYPQRVFSGTFAWSLDDAVRTMTHDEIEAVLQGPRSYWDPDYDEHSWVTDDHLGGPAYILKRLRDRIDAGYPGTELGVTEYFPGGCAHVSSGLAVADTLGVFGRMGVHVAAMWPHTCDLRFAFGGFMLLRNADGAGLRFDGTSVGVDHPEKAESSVFAASDTWPRVTVLVINKTNAPRRFGLRLFHQELADVEVHRIDPAHSTPVPAEHVALTKKNAYAYSAPPMSAALLVFRAK